MKITLTLNNHKITFSYYVTKDKKIVIKNIMKVKSPYGKVKANFVQKNIIKEQLINLLEKDFRTRGNLFQMFYDKQRRNK